MNLKKIKEKILRFWDFIWNGKSLSSYIAFLVFSAVFLPLVWKLFLFILGFFGIVDITAILTPSMVHGSNIQTTYYSWLSENGFKEEEYSKWFSPNGFNPGDAIILKKVSSPFDINVGDVIAFISYQNGPQIIHRVVEKKCSETECIYSTKGDNNLYKLAFEKEINSNQITGKSLLLIPFIGIPRMALYYLMSMAGFGYVLS